MGVLGEGKGSTLVHLMVVILSLVAFGFAIAAERRRSIGHMEPVPGQANDTYYVYSSDVATGCGVNISCCRIMPNCRSYQKCLPAIYAQNLSCEALQKGFFIAGAVFVVATMILNVYYYMYFTKCTAARAVDHKTNQAGSTVGMTGSGYALKPTNGTRQLSFAVIIQR